ncbi:MAG TPA: type II toxin-antitoxin system VapB family antitoxin [Acidobacteriota bacterium]
MKTTIEIADPLLREAHSVAKREGTTLRALVEAGLREQLKSRGQGHPFKLRLVTFRGDGLHPRAEEAGWDGIRDLIYEGRGT